MKLIPTELSGVVIVEARVFRDHRGYFMETWQRERYAAAGLPGVFVQDNMSYSTRGVLRGLHYQHPGGQGKLISVLRGEIFDVAVDIRRGSPTFGRSVGVTLSAENGRQLYIAEGFAHGFAVTGDEALIVYKCTTPYDPSCEGSLVWNDADLGIAWPVSEPRLSPKDVAAPRLHEIAIERLPVYEPGPDDPDGRAGSEVR